MSLRAGLHRHITQPPVSRTLNIIADPIFTQANHALKSACQRYRRAGGKKPAHKQSISDEDRAKINSYLLNWKSSPVTLQQAVWFVLCLQFGRRGREGWRELKTTSFCIRTDERNKRYVTESSTEISKNHQGTGRYSGLEFDEGARMYECSEALNPVEVYEFYTSKLDPSSPCLFQQTVKHPSQQQWYTGRCMGKNTLNNIMPTISAAAGTSVRYTNHCVRATTVNLLADKDVDTRTIKSITKHKAAASLESYLGSTKPPQKRICSEILSRAFQESTANPHLSDISDNELVTAADFAMSSLAETPNQREHHVPHTRPFDAAQRLGFSMNGNPTFVNCTFNITPKN